MEIPVAYLENQTVLSHKVDTGSKAVNTKWNFAFGITEKAVFDKLDTESQNQDKKEEDLSL